MSRSRCSGRGVTYQTSDGDRIEVCRRCEAAMSDLGVWPKNVRGEEYAAVHRGEAARRPEPCDGARWIQRMTEGPSGGPVGPPPSPDALRAWRTREGMSQEEAGRIAGVSRVTWTRWETGVQPVPDWLVDVIAHRWGTAPTAAER